MGWVSGIHLTGNSWDQRVEGPPSPTRVRGHTHVSCTLALTLLVALLVPPVACSRLARLVVVSPSVSLAWSPIALIHCSLPCLPHCHFAVRIARTLHLHLVWKVLHDPVHVRSDLVALLIHRLSHCSGYHPLARRIHVRLSPEPPSAIPSCPFTAP